MGEKNIVESARRMAAGQTVREFRDLRGVAYPLGAKESEAVRAAPRERMPGGFAVKVLPTFEQGRDNTLTFAEATCITAPTRCRSSFRPPTTLPPVSITRGLIHSRRSREATNYLTIIQNY